MGGEWKKAIIGRLFGSTRKHGKPKIPFFATILGVVCNPGWERTPKAVQGDKEQFSKLIPGLQLLKVGVLNVCNAW